MHTLLVIIHVSSMIASITLMTSALVLGLRGKTAAANTASCGMAVTMIGTASGAVLLVMSPATLTCIMLTMYLVAVSAIYAYGFGMGDAEKARFIRTNA